MRLGASPDCLASDFLSEINAHFHERRRNRVPTVDSSAVVATRVASRRCLRQKLRVNIFWKLNAKEERCGGKETVARRAFSNSCAMIAAMATQLAGLRASSTAERRYPEMCCARSIAHHPFDGQTLPLSGEACNLPATLASASKLPAGVDLDCRTGAAARVLRAAALTLSGGERASAYARVRGFLRSD